MSRYAKHILNILEEDGGWLEATRIRDRLEDRIKRVPSIREVNAFLRKQKRFLDWRLPDAGKTQIKQFKIKNAPEKKLPEKKLSNDFCEGER